MVQAILIQGQELKRNTEAAMLRMDQITTGNILTVTITSAMPSFGVLYLVWIYLFPGKSSIGNNSTLRKLQILVVQLERTFQKWHSLKNKDTDAERNVSFRLTPSQSFNQEESFDSSSDTSTKEVLTSSPSSRARGYNRNWPEEEILKLQGRSQFLLTRIERYIEKLVYILLVDINLYYSFRITS